MVGCLRFLNHQQFFVKFPSLDFSKKDKFVCGKEASVFWMRKLGILKQFPETVGTKSWFLLIEIFLGMWVIVICIYSVDSIYTFVYIYMCVCVIIYVCVLKIGEKISVFDSILQTVKLVKLQFIQSLSSLFPATPRPAELRFSHDVRIFKGFISLYISRWWFQ